MNPIILLLNSFQIMMIESRPKANEIVFNYVWYQMGVGFFIYYCNCLEMIRKKLMLDLNSSLVPICPGPVVTAAERNQYRATHDSSKT